MRRLILGSLLTLALGLPAIAQAAAPVYCASFTPFTFRVAANGKSADQRANEAMDVINRFLAGKAPLVKTKPAGKDVRLMVQNQTVTTVTAADAKAEKAKSTQALALSWSKKLTEAFKNSCAQR